MFYQLKIPYQFFILYSNYYSISCWLGLNYVNNDQIFLNSVRHAKCLLIL